MTYKNSADRRDRDRKFRAKIRIDPVLYEAFLSIGREQNKKYRKKLKDSGSSPYKKNPDAFRCADKKWKAKNKEHMAEYSKKQNLKRYGITPDKYNELFAAQSGRCAICGIHQDEIKKALHVDHCHETGKVRELLCQKCNMAIGLLGDNAQTVESAMDYLIKHEKS